MQLLPGFGGNPALKKPGPALTREDPDISKAREKQLILDRGRKGRKSTIVSQVASLGTINRPRAGATLLGGG